MQLINKHEANKSMSPEKIIQFGDGNFLRGFADWIIQKLNDSSNFNSSVVMLQCTPSGKKLPVLESQDYIYHVNLQGKLNGETVNSISRINCISRGINPFKDFDTYLSLAEQPEMRFIISNTTEAGICFDPEAKLSDKPCLNFPARLTQLLYHRFKVFGGAPDKGFIILPCELIFDNGKELKQCVLKYTDIWKSDLGNDYQDFKNWIINHNYICNTLVDRIVPGYPHHEIEDIEKRIGVKDNAIVQGEVYHLWVIEKPDNMTIDALRKEFPTDKAGLNVIFTDSEAPYHQRKVTLLNGPHTLLAPVSYLAGIDIVRDALNHPLIGKYIRQIEFEELLPTLDMEPEELRGYAECVLERFDNPYVNHQVTSIMLNSFPKFKTRDLPAMKTYLKRFNKLPKGIALGLAAIITFYKGGNRQDFTPITPNDDPKIINLLRKLWDSGDTRKVAEGVLSSDLIWGKGEDLNEIPGLRDLLVEYLDSIRSHGMLATVNQLITKK